MDTSVKTSIPGNPNWRTPGLFAEEPRGRGSRASSSDRYMYKTKHRGGKSVLTRVEAYVWLPLPVTCASHGRLISSPDEQLPTAYAPLLVSSGLDGGAAYVSSSDDTAFVDCSFEGNYALDDGNIPTFILAFCSALYPKSKTALVLRRLRVRGRSASVAFRHSQCDQPLICMCHHLPWLLAGLAAAGALITGPLTATDCQPAGMAQGAACTFRAVPPPSSPAATGQATPPTTT
eukprot:1178129-Prorocentrum_minimum.AAC.3